MQENEFEKQVQQKMDALKLHPSGAVWQKIEVQIRKEKRRRWILLFFPVILIGVLYGGYVFLNRNNSNAGGQQQLTKNLNEKTTIKEASTGFDSIKNKQLLKEKTGAIAQTQNTNGGKKQKIKVKGKFKITSDYLPATNFIHATTPSQTVFDTTTAIIENGKLNIEVKNSEQEKILIAKEDKPDTSVINENESTKPKKANSISKTIEIKNEDITSKENVILKKVTKNTHSWSWGISFSGGVSSMANSFLEYGQQSFNAATYSSGSPNSPVPGLYLTPSLIKPSIAFVTGISVEKNISSKILFATGLNYKLFSTTNRVGPDSANVFRANSTISGYHNFYHYIELPVSLKFQIVKFKKTQLYLTAGLSVSQLISSNALQFNNYANFYYHDNSLLNKTQIGFNTGLDIALFSSQKKLLLLGPYFNYGISNIARQGYNKHHFSFIGLRTQLFFRKK
ncbi:MAG: PorT family protein [Chitinophagaceae bacterium]|nr:PorT family protein [Chitinophagaceae bacterium]